ncbi:MAG: archaemetzincin family Zn-dependent metalloprotease [Acidilobaceae archaeon]
MEVLSVKLLIQPIGFNDRSTLHWLAEELRRRFPASLDVRISLWPIGLDYLDVFDWSRMQFKAVRVNEVLQELYRDVLGLKGSFVLGLVAGDGYVEGLNFVFGLAIPELSTATVYTSRLETGDRQVYHLRVLKEAMHELGHLLGLGHCPNRRCVMSFSNSISEVDFKEPWFCPVCVSKLKSFISV